MNGKVHNGNDRLKMLQGKTLSSLTKEHRFTANSQSKAELSGRKQKMGDTLHAHPLRKLKKLIGSQSLLLLYDHALQKDVLGDQLVA